MGQRLEEWEDRLYGILRSLDEYLERKYGGMFPLHPSRPKKGTAANPQYDGLFRLTASYSAGFGSNLGPGYVFRIGIVTLADVPESVSSMIEKEAMEKLSEALTREFPGRDISVAKDGAVMKIYGDLSF